MSLSQPYVAQEPSHAAHFPLRGPGRLDCARRWSWFAALVLAATAGGHPGVARADPFNFYQPLKKKIEDLENKAGYTPTHRSYDKSLVPYGRKALLLNNALANYKNLVGTTS